MDFENVYYYPTKLHSFPHFHVKAEGDDEADDDDEEKRQRQRKRSTLKWDTSEK